MFAVVLNVGQFIGTEKKNMIIRNKQGQFAKGSTNPWNKGKKCPQLSASLKGRIAWNKGKTCPQFSGERNGNWKGGKPRCKKCNKKLVNVYAILCQKCYHADPKRVKEFKKIMKGRTVWNKGKVNIYSKETLEKMSKSREGKPNLKTRGKNHYNWNGGSSQNRQLAYGRYKYRNWRRKVYGRDNYICQLCENDEGGNFEAHHIFPWREFKQFRYDLNNGITLCKECHLLTIGKEFLYIPRFLNLLEKDYSPIV